VIPFLYALLRRLLCRTFRLELREDVPTVADYQAVVENRDLWRQQAIIYANRLAKTVRQQVLGGQGMVQGDQCQCPSCRMMRQAQQPFRRIELPFVRRLRGEESRRGEMQVNTFTRSGEINASSSVPST